VSPAALRNNDAIVGYTLKERIGAGGYGEVWRAEAPGGLAKAVKLVYGCLDQQRASAELKALGHVKEVRHPFLLSLERIDVVDGQLVIITELADMSLKDRYEQCLSAALGGIPREELLQYLGDAADALDYMSQRYSLQHLDIKPENLLILAGRVKVADFGLVKDIRGATVSMPAGLTPVYAAPEVFDGRPSLHSDQYSLAIVYQEMLTGTLPFPGKTAAQLAAQHVSSAPRLSPLSASDAAVIARALAKRPDDRYPSCRALVDGLMTVGERGAAVAVGAASGRSLSLPEAEAGTAPTSSQPTQSVQGGRCPVREDRREAECPTEQPDFLPAADRRGADQEGDADAGLDEASTLVESLPPIEVAASDYRFRPTLFIGIGGLGGRTLRRLRHRLVDRFDNVDRAPALQMLLLDTDVRSLAQLSRADEASALKPRETVAMPLRRCQDYREDSEKLLLWLSRRWLYNIPRSLQTEGLRPLGRLAFTDHARQVQSRIRESLQSIMSAESLALSQQALGMEGCGEFPRVYLVASIGGGAGSGIVLDAAYLVRKLLAELGYPQDGVCGILLHGTGRNPEQRELATANTYACLSEWSHYCRTGRYPGDSDGLVPAIESPAGPFQDTYLVHLGDDLGERQFALAADDLAEYLYLSSVTGVGAFVDRCRRGDAKANPRRSPKAKLRTFSLCQVSCSRSGLPSAAAELLCQQVARGWCGDGNRSEEVAEQASQQARAEQLSTEQIIAQADQAACGKWNKDSEAASHDPNPSPFDSARRTGLATCLEELAAQKAKTICDWILRLVDAPNFRVRGAQQAAQWFAERLREVESEVCQQLREAQELTASRQPKGKKGGKAAAEGGDPFRFGAGAVLTAEQESLECSPELLRQVVLEGAIRFVRSLSKQVALTANRLGDLKRELGALEGQFELSSSLGDFSSDRVAAFAAAEGVPLTIIQSLQDRLPALLGQLDQQMQTGYFSQNGGLCSLLRREPELRAALVAMMRRAARTSVFHTVRDINIHRIFSLAEDDTEAGREGLAACRDAGSPRLLAHGGAKRLLLVLPDNANREGVRQAVERQLGQSPTVVVDADGDVVLCCEAEQLPLKAVAAHLIHHRPSLASIAQRLHTRIDVAWTPLG
jgi:hypothetical protein